MEVEVDEKIHDHEVRIVRIETALEGIHRRLDDMRGDIRDLRAGQRWMIGIQIAMFVVLGGLLIQSSIILLRMPGN